MEPMLSAMYDGFIKSLLFIIPQWIYLSICLLREYQRRNRKTVKK